MRTTVTLDPEVAQLLREAMRVGDQSFKQTLNEAVRRGLKGTGVQDGAVFEVKARPMNLRAGFDPARLRDLGDELEIEEFQRKTAALEEGAA